MLRYFTKCISSTRAWTRVNTFFSYASSVAGAIWIDHTFRSTVWRTSNVTVQTRACWRSLYFFTLGVWTTRRWNAWVWGDYDRCWHCRCNVLDDLRSQQQFGSLRGIKKQREKGSPVYPSVQLQMGLWFNTLHLALTPQVPWHGSTHFWFMQALSNGHSELTTHSGLQFGGLPL